VDEIAVSLVELAVGALRAFDVLQRARAHGDDLIRVGEARLRFERFARQLDGRAALLTKPRLARLLHERVGVGLGLGGGRCLGAVWRLVALTRGGRRRGGGARSGCRRGDGARGGGCRGDGARARGARGHGLGFGAAQAHELLGELIAWVELLDLVGLLLSYAEIYALTDTSNADVGGAQPALAFFDGDPFDTDVRDRALAMIRVALIDLDRLHTDPASGILVDDVAMPGATPERGHTISTISVAYSVLGFRNVLRSLGGQLELYSNNTPDTAAASTPLDSQPINLPGAASFSARVDQMLRAHAQLLYDHLTDPSGRAYSGWDVGAAAPVDELDTLDAHAAAVRGLFAAYLATGDVRFRDRAIAVFDRMDAVFWDRDGRIYAPVPAPVDDIEYTPLRFALVQSALRDMYELVATRPGEEARVPVLEDRVGRINKLVLNGWDDRNGNRLVEWPDECANVIDGLPRGGLQMAERTLTGELGTLQAPLLPGDQRIATSDREHDCVPEIDDAQLPAALADSITFEVQKP